MIRSDDVSDIERRSDESRRGFLVRATAIAAGTAVLGGTIGCDAPPVPAGGSAGSTASRAGAAWPRELMDAIADVVLPSSIGVEQRRAAVSQFVKWADGFEPVAQEMLGYGYAEVRYLPADPVPGWISQLAAIETLAAKRGSRFGALSPESRLSVINAAVGAPTRETFPAPLSAQHVVIALVSHWSSGAGAWDLALGRVVQREQCRSLATTRDMPATLSPA
jgi:hypothetical protein